MRRLPPSMILFALTVCLSLHASADGAPPPDRNLVPGVLTDQDEINAGKVSFDTLFHRGAHIFSNNFTSLDCYGEAPDGPRKRRLEIAGNPSLPFLRMNGLDATSCLECHQRLGLDDHDGILLLREPGTTASSGGISANVLIFEDFADMSNGLIRNPPHLFGLGYIQRLADEMTAELRATRDAAILEAEATGAPVQVELESKGVRFGRITALPTRALDFSELEGVSMDLVVRPFQNKGIASSLRNFVAGAMNFHFSVQPRELMERHFIADDNPSRMLPDDPEHEIMEGEVTSVAVFLAALRPPAQTADGLDGDAVARGRALFESVGCAGCHVPSLRIRDPRVTILDPRPLVFRDRQTRSESDWVSIREYVDQHLPQMVAVESSSELLHPVVLAEHDRQNPGDRPPGYTFDLNDPLLPDDCLPRLAHDEDGAVDVPLFSDLRRHRMGAGLADTRPQPTEMLSLMVPADEFLTRPLWGVADTGPWLHDGRATTLREAILLHESEGSEASPVIEAFRALDAGGQEDLLEFLGSLRLRRTALPTAPGARAWQGILLE